MSWINYFDAIFVINLPKRTDRLLDITEQMLNYDIPFTLIDAIEDKNGAEGLRLTTEKLLTECVEKELKNVLIFEDDCLFVNDPNPIMNEVVKQLPDNYHIVYLGGQIVHGVNRQQSANLFQLDTVYSTHAWGISLQGMKEIISKGLTAPIDNCLVDNIQKLQQCYITFPLLATQRAGFSNIGNSYIDWDIYITPKYNQQISNVKNH